MSTMPLPRRNAVGIASLGRYSRFVGLMKFLLPSSALALIALVLAWPNGGADRFRVPLADLGAQSVADLGITRARFFGADRDGRPFLITAERAVQRSPRLEVFDLDTLQADLTFQDGVWASLTATAGVYDRTAGRLLLTGPIDLHSDAGYELHAEDATVDLRAGTVATHRPVQGHGPVGEIYADGLRFRGDGVVAFQGVRVVLVSPPGG